jgi:hypothetical protein
MEDLDSKNPDFDFTAEQLKAGSGLLELPKEGSIFLHQDWTTIFEDIKLRT